MDYNQLNPNKMTPSELKMQLARMQAELSQRSLELNRVLAELKRQAQELEKRDDELKLRVSEITNLKVEFEKTKVELKQKRSTFKSKAMAVILGVFYGLATILFNQANSMINATPSEPGGTAMLAMAGILYFGCLIGTVFIAGGSN